MRVNKKRLKKAISPFIIAFAGALFFQLLLYQRTGYFPPLGNIGGTWTGIVIFFILLVLIILLVIIGSRWLLEEETHPRRLKIK